MAGLRIQGVWRDVLRDPDGHVAWRSEPTSNLVVFSALDLVGRLLTREPDLAGLCFWAVGEGDPAWDATAPAPDRKRSRLTKETWRRRLTPGADVTFDPSTNSLVAKVRFEGDEANGKLREFGVFGGDASPWPNSGLLFSHRTHPVFDKNPGQTLDRELRLAFDPGTLPPGVVDAVGRLLAGEGPGQGVKFFAMGSGLPEWDTVPPAPQARSALTKEVLRRPLVRNVALRYQPLSRSVHAEVDLKFDEAAAELREVGLIAGEQTLVFWQTRQRLDRRVPGRLRQTIEFTLDPSVTVATPRVVGLTRQAARDRLVAVGLELGAVREVESGAAGTVLAQIPAPGERVAEGSLVDIDLAIEPRVVVPPLLTLLRSEAEAALTALTLVPAVVIERVPGERGIVLDQDPAPGARVAKGSQVKLKVSAPEQVAAPTLVGLTPGEADAALSAAGLARNPAPLPPVPVLHGVDQIAAQNPVAGTLVDVGSLVAYGLGTTPTVSVPDLAGLKPEVARDALKAAAAALLDQLGLPKEPPGLTLGAQAYEESQQPSGTVSSQDPPKGATVALFTAVDIGLSTFKLVKVPDLVGKTQEAAVSLITAAGLRAGEIVAAPDRSTLGTVVRQAPDPGVVAPAGSAVQLAVAAARYTRTPRLIDLSLEAAIEAANASRLKVRVTNTPNPSPRSIVLTQAPLPGATVTLGGEVLVTVRDATVVAPDLVIRSMELVSANNQRLRLQPRDNRPVTAGFNVRSIRVAFSAALNPDSVTTPNSPQANAAQFSVVVMTVQRATAIVPGTIVLESDTQFRFDVGREVLPVGAYQIRLMGTRPSLAVRPFIRQRNGRPLAGFDGERVNPDGADVLVDFQLL